MKNAFSASIVKSCVAAGVAPAGRRRHLLVELPAAPSSPAAPPWSSRATTRWLTAGTASWSQSFVSRIATGRGRFGYGPRRRDLGLEAAERLRIDWRSRAFVAAGSDGGVPVVGLEPASGARDVVRRGRAG